MARFQGAALAAAMMVGFAATAAAQGSGGAAPKRAAHPAAVADSVQVNKFMSYDASAKTVNITLQSAYGSANGGMNFNGGSRGDQTITVPAGWHVVMSFKNLDAIPHSAIVIDDKMPLPMQPSNPAFPRAYTNDVTAGLGTDATDTLDFKAGKPGNYLIVCGVPGHAPSGMWIKFVVSSTATTPSYTMK